MYISLSKKYRKVIFKNRNKIGNHQLTRTSNNSEIHEKSSLNLKKINNYYNNKAKAKLLYGFKLQTGTHFKTPWGKGRYGVKI